MQRHIAQSALARYGIAVASVALAIMPALWLRPLALAGAQFLLVAVLITGWVSGLRPALVAWGLAAMAWRPEYASERYASRTWSTRSTASCGKRTPRPSSSCS